MICIKSRNGAFVTCAAYIKSYAISDILHKSFAALPKSVTDDELKHSCGCKDGWPGTFQPRAPTESRRDSLPSPGSCHLVRQADGTHCQCLNMVGYVSVTPLKARRAFLTVLSRRYLFWIQRTR